MARQQRLAHEAGLDAQHVVLVQADAADDAQHVVLVQTLAADSVAIIPRCSICLQRRAGAARAVYRREMPAKPLVTHEPPTDSEGSMRATPPPVSVTAEEKGNV